ncbi:MAG TPA: hypothetical protein VF815_46630, partial [Myxococcaceae bacterium]
MSTALELVVEAGDITETRADVALFKYTQRFYGAAGLVAQRLLSVGIPSSQLEVKQGDFRFVETQGGITAPLVLFLGTVRLGQFGYHEIRQFAVRALKALESRPGLKHLAATVHGPNYGL